MKKINEKQYKPTFDEPKSIQANDFSDDFNKEMVKQGIQLENVDVLLNEKEQSLKKKIFSLSKMEALVHNDPRLSAVYEEMVEDGEEKYGYHYNETIMNIIFNDYILNSPKYLRKYKMARGKKKKRRDRSGINQLKKTGEKQMDKSKNKTNDELNENNDLDSIKDKAKNISKEEGVVQHVNKISDNRYDVSDWYDDEKTIASYENGTQINEESVDETTSASSAAGGSSSYVGYATPHAWSKSGKTDKDAYWDGGKVIQESDYLTDPTLFENYINMLDNNINEESKSKSQQRLMGMVHAYKKGELKDSEVTDKVKEIAKSMSDKDAEDFASTKHDDIPEKVNEHHLNNKEDKIEFIVSVGNKIDSNNPNDPQSDENIKRVLRNLDDDAIHKMYLHSEKKLKDKGLMNEDHLDNREDKISYITQNYKELFPNDPLVTSGEIENSNVFKSVSDDILNMIYHEIENEKMNEETMIDNQEDSMAMSEPINTQSGGISRGFDNMGLAEELKKVLKDLQIMERYNKKLMEDRKPSSLVNKDRLGNENQKNFKKDMKDSGTKEVIDSEDKTSWKEQQTTIDDPQKLNKDIEKEVIKNTKGDSFENVGNSTNNKGDEIPKRNLTDDEMDEVDLYRKGLGDYVYDNKPDERFEERMKRDMGEENYKKRQKRMEFAAEAPMYNKDTQPVDDKSLEKDQFDKEKSGWNKRTGVNETKLVGKFYDEFGKKRFLDFNSADVKEVKDINESWYNLNLDGLGNTYNSKVEMNESVSKIINNSSFYTNGNDVYVIESKNNLNEDIKRKEINEEYNKMKHLFNYKPKDYIKNNKI